MSDDVKAVRSQVRLVVKSMKSKIADKIIEKCAAVPGIKYVAFDKVRLLAAHFKEFEIPAIQLIDVNLTSEHENSRSKNYWQIALELLMRGSENGEVSQQDLWNLEYLVKRALWQQPNLGIKGVIHLKFLGSTTDLHLLEPYYFSRLDFEAQYYEDLVRSADCC